MWSSSRAGIRRVWMRTAFELSVTRDEIGRRVRCFLLERCLRDAGNRPVGSLFGDGEGAALPPFTIVHTDGMHWLARYRLAMLVAEQH